jgi:hypothetical protein
MAGIICVSCGLIYFDDYLFKIQRPEQGSFEGHFYKSI